MARRALVTAVALAAGALLMGPAGAANSSVTIQDYSFNPGSVSIAVGDMVTWHNNGPSTHTVTSDTGAFDSGNVAPATGSFQYTFTQPGTYHYHCNIHSSMHGTVTVSGGPPPPTQPPPTQPPPTHPAPAPTAAPTTRAPAPTAAPATTAAPTTTSAPTTTVAPAVAGQSTTSSTTSAAAAGGGQALATKKTSGGGDGNGALGAVAAVLLAVVAGGDILLYRRSS